MTPPGPFEGPRCRLLVWILCATLTQAAALAAVAFATRTVFVSMHAGASLPVFSIAIIVGAGSCGALMQVVFRVFAERLGQNYAKDVRLKLFDHASRSDQRDLDQRRMGYHVLRFTGDLSALKDWPGLGLPRLVQAAVMLPTATAVLIYLDPRFVWVAICVVCPSALWAMFTHPKLLKIHSQLRKLRAQLAADVTERLPIAPRLSALGRRSIEMKSLGRRAEQVEQAACNRRGFSEIRKAIPEFSAATGAGLIMLVGGINDLSTGTIAAALAALGLMIRPLRNAMTSSDHYAKYSAAYANLSRALKRPLAAARSSETRLLSKSLSVEIRTECGSELKLCPGQEAAISKALMDKIELALLGNAVLNNLTLKLDGKAVPELTPGSLRRSVGVLTGRPLILKGSLRRALTLGLKQRPSDEQILQVAESIALREVVREIGGLDFKLTERGTNLTVDQRISVSCLRLSLQQPGLILARCAPTSSFKSHSSWQLATKLTTSNENTDH